MQNPLLEGGDLSTMIAIDPKSTQVDEFGNATYRNRRTVSAKMYCSLVYSKLQARGTSVKKPVSSLHKRTLVDCLSGQVAI